jgi:hypothetical protein
MSSKSKSVITAPDIINPHFYNKLSKKLVLPQSVYVAGWTARPWGYMTRIHGYLMVEGKDEAIGMIDIRVTTADLSELIQ